MKRKLAGRPALAAVIVAVASLSAAPALAQSGNETFWLECLETAVIGSDSLNISVGFLSISPNSVVHYVRDNSRAGGIRRWYDHCEELNAQCTMNDDEIVARFSIPAEPDLEYTVRIDRRSGEYTRSSRDGNRVEGQCRRIADPRPPAAF
jgi:hypothetical protein